MDMVSEFMALNATALEQLSSDETVEIRKFPDEVLNELKELTYTVLDELAAEDPMLARVWTSYREFMNRSQPWQAISEGSYLSTRELP